MNSSAKRDYCPPPQWLFKIFWHPFRKHLFKSTRKHQVFIVFCMMFYNQVRGHPLSKYAKFSEKLTFVTS